MAASRSVRDLITRALRVSTVIGAGEPADADDAGDALLSLNMMLDAWQAEQLFAYAIIDRTHALTQGLGTYTVGAAGTINIARPIRIAWAFSRNANGLDLPMQVIPAEVYQAIFLKSIGNNYPTALYYEPTYPLGIIHLWELPQAGLTLHFGSWEVLAEFPALATIVSVPPGYEDALTYSLAERLCVEYDKPVSQGLAKQAQMARANIQQDNLLDLRMACEFGGVNDQTLLPGWVFASGLYY